MSPVAFGDCVGWLHPAAGARGVVVCPTWGFEALCVHRGLKILADDLASAGLPCLRFDPPGCGDALDPQDTARLVERWLQALQAAVGFLRARTGVREVALVGVRLGALLAAEAAGRLGGVARLALLAPPASGRTCVRELRAWARLARGTAGDRGAPAARDGDLVIGGFTIRAAALDDLARLDPFAAAVPPARHILVLERPDARAGLDVAIEAWRAGGTEVALHPLRGYAEFVRDPLLSEPPGEAFARVVETLARDLPERDPGRVAAPEPAPPAMLVGPGFREETLRLGPGGRLAGVLTTPANGRGARGRPALLILNTGATHRVGAGRSAVELARALAGDGIVSFRLDLGGLGDSDLPPGEHRSDIYRRGALADVRAAADLLEARGVAGIVAFGVCSGAFMAFHAALGDPRLVGLVLVDLPRFRWRPFHPLVFVPTRTILGLLAKGGTWIRGLRRDADLGPALRVLSERLVARLALALPGAFGRVAAALSRPGRSLRALARRGAHILVLYAADDPGLALFDRVVAGRRGTLLGGGLEVRVVEGATHTFGDPDSRAVLLSLTRRHLLRHWPAEADPRSTPATEAKLRYGASAPPPTDETAPAAVGTR